MSYFAQFGQIKDYMWRFDKEKAGSGALFDIGSHFIYLAYWFFGPIHSVYCKLESRIERNPVRPDGTEYEFADDYCLLNLTFKNGVNATLDISTIANNDGMNGQTQKMEFNGSNGTLQSKIDRNYNHPISVIKQDSNKIDYLDVPGIEDEDTLFSKQNTMGRLFVHSIFYNEQTKPNFKDGLYIQKIMELAIKSNEKQQCLLI